VKKKEHNRHCDRNQKIQKARHKNNIITQKQQQQQQQQQQQTLKKKKKKKKTALKNKNIRNKSSK
jgi:hypothetical protein